jgi:ABC-type molybdate transport system substrate-binding protein
MASITSTDRAWVPTVATALVFWMLLAVAALMPEVCPAVAADSTGCVPGSRESAAMTGSMLVLAAASLGVALTYLLPAASRPLVQRMSMIAVAVVGSAALVMTVGASGFRLL